MVEVDSWEYHRMRSAFEGDRDRDVKLDPLGINVLRFTDRQLSEEPSVVASRLKAAVSRRLGSTRAQTAPGSAG